MLKEGRHIKLTPFLESEDYGGPHMRQQRELQDILSVFARIAKLLKSLA